MEHETDADWFRTPEYIAKEKQMAEFMAELFKGMACPGDWHIRRTPGRDRAFEVSYESPSGIEDAERFTNVYKMGSAKVVGDFERNPPTQIHCSDDGAKFFRLAIQSAERKKLRYDLIWLDVDETGIAVEVSWNPRSDYFDHEGRFVEHDPIPFTLQILKDYGVEFILLDKEKGPWHRNEDVSLAPCKLHALHDVDCAWTTNNHLATRRIIYPSGWCRRRWTVAARRRGTVSAA
jgi:hypothetical protein